MSGHQTFIGMSIIDYMMRLRTMPKDTDEFMNIKETEMEDESTKVRVVNRSHFTLLPLSGYEPQKLDVSHCVHFIQIDRHYGEFNLLDDSRRIVATSKQSKLSLLKKDLNTDVGRVWYDAISRSSLEFKRLHDTYKVEDPGLDLGCMPPVFIQFLAPPKDALKFVHIPVYCRISAVWDPVQFAYVTHLAPAETIRRSS